MVATLGTGLQGRGRPSYPRHSPRRRQAAGSPAITLHPARTGDRLRFCCFGYARKRAGPTLQNRRLPPGRLPDSANSCRFHSAPLQSRQRTAPLARSFIPLHATLESSETGRMNRPCHASCRSHETRQLRPLRGNGFDECRAKRLSVDLSANAVRIYEK